MEEAVEAEGFKCLCEKLLNENFAGSRKAKY